MDTQFYICTTLATNIYIVSIADGSAIIRRSNLRMSFKVLKLWKWVLVINRIAITRKYFYS